MKNIMSKVRIYKISDSVTFAKVNERYGIYSNMAGNLCLFVNDVNIPSSEALYQACKFPLFPKIQHEILSQKNAMSAKKVARKYEAFVRQDWNEIKFKVMRWCLQVKSLQNWEVFANELIASADKPIVEYSKKDSVWGAMPNGNGTLSGVNALGRLLMELRMEINLQNPIKKVLPPNIDGFLLYGNKIETTYAPEITLEDL